MSQFYILYINGGFYAEYKTRQEAKQIVEKYLATLDNDDERQSVNWEIIFV